MSINTKTTTIDSSSEDRQHVQGMEDDNGGVSGSKTVQVDWQQQGSVDFS